jgi:hypothetical protein
MFFFFSFFAQFYPCIKAMNLASPYRISLLFIFYRWQRVRYLRCIYIQVNSWVVLLFKFHNTFPWKILDEVGRLELLYFTPKHSGVLCPKSSFSCLSCHMLEKLYVFGNWICSILTALEVTFLLTWRYNRRRSCRHWWYNFFTNLFYSEVTSRVEMFVWVL